MTPPETPADPQEGRAGAGPEEGAGAEAKEVGAATDAEAPKPKRKRTRKPTAKERDEGGAAREDEAPKPARRRRRAQAEKPVEPEPVAEAEPAAEEAEAPAAEEAQAPAVEAAEAPAADAEPAVEEAEAPTAEAEPAAEEPPAARERPSRPAPARGRPGERVVVRAQAKYVRSSARKARLVCDLIRGKTVQDARAVLALSPRAAARDWSKVLESAVANAENNHELDGDGLRILTIKADEGPTLKRYRPRAMGRATRIRKRTSHLTILLTPKE
jgi:ribosomal protein L22